MNTEMNSANINQNVKRISLRIETIQLQTKLLFTLLALKVKIFVKIINRNVKIIINVLKKVLKSLSSNS